MTGSNAVNVFLGLGLPWMIGALYWHIKGATPEWQVRAGREGWWHQRPVSRLL